MTTILADVRRRVMVAESNISMGETDRFRTHKVRYCRGAMLATAGDAAIGAIFERWFAQGEDMRDRGALKTLMSRDEDDSFEAIVMRADGLWYYATPFPIRIIDRYYAIGSGAHAALAAIETMRRLKKPVDPVLAVTIACKVDPASRGPVRSYVLGGRP